MPTTTELVLQVHYEDGGGTVVPVTPTARLPVDATITPSGTQDVNIVGSDIDVPITLDGEEVTLWRGGSQADKLFVGWNGSQQVTVSGSVSVQTQGATTLAVEGTVDQGDAGAERWLVEDKDTTLEVLADQAGADGVLTFTFSAASQPWVYVDTGDSVRVTTAAQTPTATFGLPVAPGSAFPVPVQTTTIRVYAATGQTVMVYGTR